MAEMRWNPMIGDWVIVAGNRQKRPDMPKGYCAFCPGAKNIPEHYTVLEHDNDWPALSTNPGEPDDVANSFFKVEKNYGKCEVILFSPNHNASIYDLTDDHMGQLIDLWIERYNLISSNPKIKYVFIFENRGELVGVSQPHPHGQIYGYGQMPKKIELELDAARSYKEENCECLFCRLNREEISFGKRIVAENDEFVAYIPFFADYAYGVYVAAKKHISHISQFDEQQKYCFGRIIRDITGGYDALFDMRFPYMMCMHNAPVNTKGTKYESCEDYFHFHVEFYPPMRGATSIQYMASSETGVWVHCNPTVPEQRGPELREAIEKFHTASEAKNK